MRRIDDEHRMELESDRARLDVAHAGQQQRRENFTIRRAAFDFGSHLLQHTFAGRVLQQPDQRLNLGMQPHHARFELRLGGGDRGQLREKAQIAQGGQRTSAKRGSQKIAAFHGWLCSLKSFNSGPVDPSSRRLSECPFSPPPEP